MSIGSPCNQKAVFPGQGEKKGVKGLFFLASRETSRHPEPIGIIDFQSVQPQSLQVTNQRLGGREAKSRVSQDCDPSSLMEGPDGFFRGDLRHGSPFPRKMHGFTDHLFLRQGFSFKKKSGGGLGEHLPGPFLTFRPLIAEKSGQGAVMRVKTITQEMDPFSMELCSDLHPGNDHRAADAEMEIS